MTRRAKIGIAVTVFAGITLLSVVAVFIYFVAGVVRGVSLTNDGYMAVRAGHYDIAISRFDVALKEPLGKYLRQQVRLNRAFALSQKGRCDEAIAEYTEGLRFNSEPPASAYEWRAWNYQQKGETQKAMADFDEAIRLNPNSGWAYYSRGLVWFRRAENDKALADFEEAVRCYPDRAEALIMRGLCYVAKNDLEGALSSFDGAIALDPMNSRAYLERSKAYLLRGEYEKRDRDYEEALRLDPNIEMAPRNFFESLADRPRGGWSDQYVTRDKGKDFLQLFREGNAAYHKGDYDRAITSADELLARDLGVANASLALMNRANAYAAKNNYDQAMRDYDDAIRLDPKNSGAYVDRGLVWSRRADRERARKDFDEAIRLNPSRWEAYFNRAADFVDDGRLDEALADFTKAVELNPSFVSTYLHRSAIYAKKAKIDLAISECNKAIDLDPNSPPAYVARARIRCRQGKYAEVVRDMKKAEEISGTISAQDLNFMAWLQATSSEPQLRDGRKAVEAASKACALTKWKTWGYIDTLAAAYAEVGEFENATKYQQKALDLAPASDSGAKEAKSRLTLYRAGKPYREKPK